MLANFDRYDLILQARKSKKFRDLDDKVRMMAFELGKKNPDINKTEYLKLKTLRDQELTDFIKSLTPITNQKPFDRTVYQKIDTKITQKIDLYLSKFPNNKFKNFYQVSQSGHTKRRSLMTSPRKQDFFSIRCSLQSLKEPFCLRDYQEDLLPQLHSQGP